MGSNLEEAIKDIHSIMDSVVAIEQERIIAIIEESIEESESLAGVAYPKKAKELIEKIRGI